MFLKTFPRSGCWRLQAVGWCWVSTGTLCSRCLQRKVCVCDVFGICVRKMSATRCLYLCSVCVSGCVCVLAECDSQQRLQGYRSGLSLLLVPARGRGDPMPPALILQGPGRCRKLIKTFAELIKALKAIGLFCKRYFQNKAWPWRGRFSYQQFSFCQVKKWLKELRENKRISLCAEAFLTARNKTLWINIWTLWAHRASFPLKNVHFSSLT